MRQCHACSSYRHVMDWHLVITTALLHDASVKSANCKLPSLLFSCTGGYISYWLDGVKRIIFMLFSHLANTWKPLVQRCVWCNAVLFSMLKNRLRIKHAVEIFLERTRLITINNNKIMPKKKFHSLKIWMNHTIILWERGGGFGNKNPAETQNTPS